MANSINQRYPDATYLGAEHEIDDGAVKYERQPQLADHRSPQICRHLFFAFSAVPANICWSQADDMTISSKRYVGPDSQLSK